MLINGRTPDEIKAAIEKCVDGDCKGCAYYDVMGCSTAKAYDALALIEQLEAQLPRWISVKERLPPPETKIYLIASHSPDGEQIVKTSVWAWDEIEKQAIGLTGMLSPIGCRFPNRRRRMNDGTE